MYEYFPSITVVLPKQIMAIQKVGYSAESLQKDKNWTHKPN